MSRIDVSDHAVLRWLERVEGVDVSGIRRRIANATRSASERGASGVRVEGVTFTIDYRAGHPVVVTTHSQFARPHLAQPRKPAGG